MTTVVAVDFGASSIRVCRVGVGVGDGDGPLSLSVVHRYAHRPVTDARGHLRWDWGRLVSEMEKGLTAALQAGPVASIGIDTWGVDYGLLDANGRLLSAPFSYRDHRTDGYEDLVSTLGADTLYSRTGIQLQPFNTLFQLAVHDRCELAKAKHLLLLPELLVHHLTGAKMAEQTSAGTTALIDIDTAAWSSDLLAVLGVDPAILPPISAAGTFAGEWHGIPVHLVAGHDTASAVAAIPIGDRDDAAAFVSSGSWLLVGREQPEPDLSDAARYANFTNEPRAFGGYLKLKNLAGWSLVERCRQSWGSESVESLLAGAARLPAPRRTFDVCDPCLLQPTDMLGTVTSLAGLPRDARPATVLRAILAAMAAGTAAVLDQLGGIADVWILGGGARANTYRDDLRALIGLPVRIGPAEATAVGNAVVQAIALGIYADLPEARSCLTGSVRS